LVRPEAQAVFPYSNSLFIDDEVKAMIDAGSGGRAYAQIPMGKIDLLFLTHHHFDHINGVSFFSNAEKLAGREEAWAFQDEAEYKKSTGYDRWQVLMGSPKSENWEKVIQLPDDVPSYVGFQAIELAGLFKDGDVFKLGETSFTAVHTPGHSPGHYAFFFPQESILFSADLDVSPRGPWYGNESCDLDDIIQSIYKLIALKPQTIVSSHRKVFDSGIEDLLMAYLNIALQRDEKILNYLTQPRSINDIVAQDFINEWEARNQHVLFWHKMMVLKHLKRLGKLGKVAEISDDKSLALHKNITLLSNGINS
jgi:glyoxylase-like metal-dependent hydrolase (beta-lactamase superfamily II)